MLKITVFAKSDKKKGLINFLMSLVTIKTATLNRLLEIIKKIIEIIE